MGSNEYDGFPGWVAHMQAHYNRKVGEQLFLQQLFLLERCWDNRVFARWLTPTPAAAAVTEHRRTTTARWEQQQVIVQRFTYVCPGQ
jgi:hypothetical protein